MDRDEKTAKPKRFLLALNEAMSTDGFDEVVPVLDSENMEKSPEGDYLFPRRGSAIYRTYQLPAPGERMRLMVESQPPNLTDGSELAMIVSSNGIEAMKLFKTRTNLPGDTFQSKVFFASEGYSVSPGGEAELTIRRTGALDRSVTVEYETIDSSAIDGTDYTAETGVITFASGQVTQTISISTSAVVQTEEKQFFVKIQKPTGGAVIENPRIATVTIGEGAPAVFLSGYYSAAGGDFGDTEAYEDLLILVRSRETYTPVSFLLHTSRGFDTASSAYHAVVETQAGIVAINNAAPISGVQVDFFSWDSILALPFVPNPEVRVEPDASDTYVTARRMYKGTRDSSALATISSDGIIYVPLLNTGDTIDLLRIDGSNGAILGNVTLDGGGAVAFDSGDGSRIDIGHLDSNGLLPVYFQYGTSASYPAAEHRFGRFDPTDGTSADIVAVHNTLRYNTPQGLFTQDKKSTFLVDGLTVEGDSGNIVTNGTFEDAYTDGKSANWIDWAASGTHTYFDSTYDKRAGSHSQGMVPNGEADGGLYQILTTVPGQTYTVTVSLKERTLATESFLGIGYALDGGIDGATAVYPSALTASAAKRFEWDVYTTEFTATGTSTTLFVRATGITQAEETLVVLYDSGDGERIFSAGGDDTVLYTLTATVGPVSPATLIRREVILDDAGRFLYVDPPSGVGTTVECRLNQDASENLNALAFTYTKNFSVSYEIDLFTTWKGAIAGIGRNMPTYTSAGWSTNEYYGYDESQIVELLTGEYDLHVQDMWAPINSGLTRQMAVSGSVE